MWLRTGTGGAGRPLDGWVSLGALTSPIPRDAPDEAIEAHDCREEHVRELPAQLVGHAGWSSMSVSVARRRWPSRGAITPGPEAVRTGSGAGALRQPGHTRCDRGCDRGHGWGHGWEPAGAASCWTCPAPA